MTRRNRLIGVDFSGARDAGRHIWVATGSLFDGRLNVEDCVPGEELHDSATDRATVLSALVKFLLSERSAAVGLDFPFSLPEIFIDTGSWEAYLHAFAVRFPNPEAFREDCRRRANGRELKRRTDVEARVPFGVYNLRLYRQTHAGMVGVLLPLLESGGARILPMQRPAAGKTTIVEICPASILKSENLYAPYKGNGPRPQDARRNLLTRLIACGFLAPLRKNLAERLIENKGGDGTDAILAAIGAGRLPVRSPLPDRLDLLEGRVYF